MLVGVKGWLNSALEKELEGPVSRGEVRVLGFIQDSELTALYSSAIALTYPSIYEGFGLPPLEAMACGTPAIVSNAASLPEVVGSQGMMHEPLDHEALHSYMNELLHDKEFRAMQEGRALLRAAQFSWALCSAATLDAYRRVVNSLNRRSGRRSAIAAGRFVHGSKFDGDVSRTETYQRATPANPYNPPFRFQDEKT